VFALRRNTEEYVADDWAAVAHAINQRMTELGLRQRQLIERSRVSKAVVSELMRNVAPRRRSARTLEALSVALDWHPDHLAAVLAKAEPPALSDPVHRPDDVPGRLAAIERQLRDITTRLDDLRSSGDEQFTEMRKALEALADGISRDGKPGR
jgi:transcriptional regulator with XRE-family HTH domain